MNPFELLAALWPSHYSTDPEYRTEEKLTEAFDHTQISDTLSPNSKTDQQAMLLDLAREKHSIRLRQYAALEAKRSKLLGYAISIPAILFATSKYLQIDSVWVPVSMSLIALAFAVLLIAGWTHSLAAFPKIREVREVIYQHQYYQDWLAARYHMTMEGIEVRSRKLGDLINLATLLILLGAVALIPATVW